MKTSIAHFKGTIYPDKSFSLGIVPRKKKTAEDKRYDRNWSNQWDAYIETQQKYGRLEYKSVAFFRGIIDYSLFISSPKSSQTRGKYGGKGITGYGRKVVVNSSLLLQRKLGRERLGFCTLTLPNFSKEVLGVLCQSWHEITRRFFQKFKRLCEKKNCSPSYVATTEIQEKRYKNTGIPVLHTHFVFQCKRNKRNCDFFFTPDELRRLWIETLYNIVSNKGLQVGKTVFLKNCLHIQVVRKSASNYLGKYISKGANVTRKIIEEGNADMLPSQWWSASSDVKEMFKDSLVCMDAKTCESFFYNLEEYLHEKVFLWANFVEVEINGEYIKMGAVGILSDEAYRLIVQT